MEDQHDKIVVLRSYDTIVEANLAKTKLDAYGIPCFLTDEHLTNLYPIRNAIFPGARLHIFERDLIEAESILHENKEGSFIKCPHCGSQKHQPYISGWSKFNFFIAGLFGWLFPKSPYLEYQCEDCGKQFA